MAKAAIRKRSIIIKGHSTSITLEDVFWKTLKVLAKEKGQSLAHLIADIDRKREGNLSSALRIYALEETLKKKN